MVDGAFVDEAVVIGRSPLTRVRIDREGTDGHRIGLGHLREDIGLGEDIGAHHASAFADVENGRPVSEALEFVFAEAELLGRLADRRR